MGIDGEWLRAHVRELPDHPEPGVSFKDITPLLASTEAFAATIDAVSEPYSAPNSEYGSIDKVIGIEARGFMIAAPVAYRLGAGFVPVRKAGKLPWKVESEAYTLEYGAGELELHSDAIARGERVLIIDDVLATGGTASATVRLAERLGGNVVGLGFLIELAFLGGRDRLPGHAIHSLVRY
jgi:adenine phosphoribosyltransferase